MASSSPPESAPRRTVKCPNCGKPAPWAADNRWRPFCSQRCRQIDLGAWASDQYRVAGSDVADDPGDRDEG